MTGALENPLYLFSELRIYRLFAGWFVGICLLSTALSAFGFKHKAQESERREFVGFIAAGLLFAIFAAAVGYNTTGPQEFLGIQFGDSGNLSIAILFFLCFAWVLTFGTAAYIGGKVGDVFTSRISEKNS